MVAQQSAQPFELYVDAANVNGGMDVYSRDGDKLGIVSEVWAYIPPYGYVAKSRFTLADYGPIRGTMHLFDGADGYIQVIQQRGIRREHATDLYLPLDTICDVVTGQALVVADHREVCQGLFAHRPEYLDESR